MQTVFEEYKFTHKKHEDRNNYMFLNSREQHFVYILGHFLDILYILLTFLPIMMDEMLRFFSKRHILGQLYKPSQGRLQQPSSTVPASSRIILHNQPEEGTASDINLQHYTSLF